MSRRTLNTPPSCRASQRIAASVGLALICAVQTGCFEPTAEEGMETTATATTTQTLGTTSATVTDGSQTTSTSTSTSDSTTQTSSTTTPTGTSDVGESSEDTQQSSETTDTTQASDESMTSEGSDTTSTTQSTDESTGDTTTPTGECAGASACVDVAPPGWNGPVVHAPSQNANPLACKGDYSKQAADATVISGDAGDSSCSACTCGAVDKSKVGCLVDFTTHDNISCGGSSIGKLTLKSGDCATWGPVARWQYSVKLGQPYNENGPVLTCQPQGGVVSNPPLNVTSAARICESSQALATCDSGAGVCAPAAPSGFDQAMCIWKAGNDACPSGSIYRQKKQLYVPDEGRTCEACSCLSVNPTQFECSGGKIDVFTQENSSCDGSVSSADPGSCTQNFFGAKYKMSVRYSGATVTGSATCQPRGGSPQGSFEWRDPIALCCTQ